MPERSARIAVLGGGIAGLATAFNLETGALDSGLDACVTVFERSDSVGGKLRTIREDGYLIEEGPNGWLDNEPATARLLSRVGLETAALESEEATRHRFLLLGGRMHELPLSPKEFVKTGLLSPISKLRVAAELVVPRRGGLGRAAEDPSGDETIFEFGRRRLGRGFAETFLDPMAKGIFGGDARRLSLAATFPRMVELEREYGGLFRAMMKLSKRRRGNGDAPSSPAGPGGTLTTLDGGMRVLPATLRAALSGRVRTGSPVREVWRDGDSWWVRAGADLHGADRHGPFDCVIDATPAHAAAGHLYDPVISRLLQGISYVPMAVVALAFDRAHVRHPLYGFGMLCPSSQRSRLLGVLWSTSIFKGRAPDGKVVLRCMAGGTESPDAIGLTDDRLVRLCMEEVASLYGIKGDPERVWIVRHERAIAQYERGHLARMREISLRLRSNPGLLLTGSSYRGVSTNHCVAEAERVAREALDFISAQATAGIGRPELQPVARA
jgi:oxygen-dependent protoporphyrinogen oxidase